MAIKYHSNLLFADNNQLRLGTGSDLRIYHNGSNSFIQDSGTGDLRLMSSHLKLMDASENLVLGVQAGAVAVTGTLTVGVDDTGYDVKFFGATSGRYMLWDESDDQLEFSDNAKISLGASEDLQLYHSGSASVMRTQGTGDLYIQQTIDDKDIIFQSDDGAGGVTTYFQLDGSQATHDGSATTALATVFPDNSKIHLGSGSDGRLWHDGSDTYLQNTTGDLIIQNFADDKDVILKSDDGSGGTTAYITLDGSATTTVFYKDARFNDSIDLNFGNANDLILRHDGSNSYILNSTGDLYIKNNADDKDIIFQGDDGGSNTITALTLDMSDAGTAIFNHDIKLVDNGRIKLGDAGNDLEISHSGTNSFIENNTGNLNIIQHADDGDIIFQADDQSGGDAVYFRLDGSTGYVRFEDNRRIAVGSGDDLHILHDGSNSLISQQGTGDLYIENTVDDGDIVFRSDDGSGGNAEYFRLDGGNEGSYFSKHVHFIDSVQLRIGNGNDAAFYHDASDTYLTNGTGDFYIQNTANDKDVIFRCDDGAGGNTTYFTLDGSVAAHDGSATTALYTSWGDKSRVALGTSRDMQLYHDGTSSYIQNQTGDLTIINYKDDKDIIFKCDDGSGGTETYFYLDGSASSGNPITIFPDSSGLFFGTGADCMLRHDGTDMTFQNNAGDLIISCATNDKDVILKSDDGSGGTTAYITLDGSNAFTQIHKDFYFLDSVKSYFGSDGDSYIRHTGSNFDIINSTGNITIDNGANNYDIIFKGTDNSGDITALTLDMSSAGKATFNSSIVATDFLELESSGDTGHVNSYILMNATQSDARGAGVYMHNTNADNEFFAGVPYAASFAEYIISYQSTADHSEDTATTGNALFRLDSSGNLTLTGDVTVGDDLFIADNGILNIGSGNDLQVYHDATNTIMLNNTGDLYIKQHANDKDILFQCDDGSGGVETYFYLDGSNNFSQVLKHIRFVDNVSVLVGSSSDLSITHDGTNSVIANSTGNLQINQNVDDGDLILQCDDGSGGTTAYITLDGSATAIKLAQHTSLADGKALYVGNSNDGAFYHSTNTFLTNATGDFTIVNYADDKDIIFQSDDGSGGVETYFFLDGSSSRTIFPDSKELVFGTDSNLFIFHDGTNSYIQNYTSGDFYIDQRVDDKDIVFRADDGAGSTATYFRLDGSAATHDGSATTNIYTQWLDNSNIALGSAKDFIMRHNGTKTTLENKTGNLIIENVADDADIIFNCDDGSGGKTAYLTLDGSSGYTKAHKHILYEDDAKAMFGTGGDMQILHDGSNSYISQNVTGELYIENNATDGDVIFRSDDGSGGTTEYFRLDGGLSATYINRRFIFSDSTQLQFGNQSDTQIYNDGSNFYIDNITGDQDIIFKGTDGSSDITALTLDMSDAGTAIFNHDIKLADNNKAFFGGGTDLSIYHDGSNSYILHNGDTGNLVIQNSLDDTDIIFKCDDGSGGTETYFFLDGSLSSGNPFTKFPDNSILTFGNGADGRLYHDATDTIIENYTGDLYIQNKADDKDIIFRSDDGSGGVATYFQLDGSESLNRFYKNVLHQDSVESMWGTGLDLKIKHDGSNSYIRNFTGDLYILNAANDKDVILQSDDGSGGVTAYLTLDGSAETTIFSKPLRVSDSVAIEVGTGADLQLSHNGTNSSIVNYVGDLNITNGTDDGDITFNSDDGSGGTTAYLTIDGSASLVQCHVDLAITTQELIRDASNVNKYIQLSDSSAFMKFSAYNGFQFHTYNGSSYGERGRITNTGEFQIPRREFAKTGTSDGDHDGDVVYFGGTTSMVAGKLYHYKSDGTWELADASAVATCDGLLGVSLGTASDTDGVLLRGMVTIANDPGAVGDVLFVSESAGQCIATAPSTSNAIVRVVGYCLDASNGQIWFNPDGTFVEVA